MINDHRPYQLKKLSDWIERAYSRHFVFPHFESVGENALVMKPWNVDIHGAHIRAGENLHVITAKDRRVALSTWKFEEAQGHIALGDHCLICPGVRIDSASLVEIADSCMIAAGAYITDADWHDLYDRTRAIGTTSPVRLEENVWIGDGATVCKGVTIGRNSVVGARAIVTNDVPSNVIVAGNPAKVVKQLDQDRELVTRATLFSDVRALDESLDRIDRYVLGPNSFLKWLRTLVAPRTLD